MANYNTEKRRIIIGFLAQNHDTPLSAGQIADELKDKSISASAVYRNLAFLESIGRVRREIRVGSREAVYYYTDTEECRDSVHLSCTRCGKTFHMNNGSTRRLAASLAKTQSFELSFGETVLYGVCGGCKGGAK